jgi:hypothetical protein
MSAFSPLEIQKSVLAALTGDSALMGLVSGVYDYVSPDVVFPYIAIGSSSSRDRSTKTTTGLDVTFVLNIYSREGGHKEALLMMERVHHLLHQANLSLTGHALVLMHFDGSTIGRTADGLTYHGIMQFRALTESN